MKSFPAIRLRIDELYRCALLITRGSRHLSIIPASADPLRMLQVPKNTLIEELTPGIDRIWQFRELARRVGCNRTVARHLKLEGPLDPSDLPPVWICPQTGEPDIGFAPPASSSERIFKEVWNAAVRDLTADETTSDFRARLIAEMGERWESSSGAKLSDHAIQKRFKRILNATGADLEVPGMFAEPEPGRE